MTKKATKHHYFQNWGTYDTETLVVVGLTQEETIRLIQKATKSDGEWANSFREETADFFNRAAGFTYKDGSGHTLLWLRDWVNDWRHIDLLVHELNHLIQYVMVQIIGAGTELEAMAYQQEFLFRAIRRKLFDLTKKKGKKNGSK